MAQLIMSSYPFPFSILPLGGIDHNIIDDNRSRIDTLPSTDKLAEPAITSYLVCFVR